MISSRLATLTINEPSATKGALAVTLIGRFVSMRKAISSKRVIAKVLSTLVLVVTLVGPAQAKAPDATRGAISALHRIAPAIAQGNWRAVCAKSGSVSYTLGSSRKAESVVIGIPKSQIGRCVSQLHAFKSDLENASKAAMAYEKQITAKVTHEGGTELVTLSLKTGASESSFSESSFQFVYGSRGRWLLEGVGGAMGGLHAGIWSVLL